MNTDSSFNNTELIMDSSDNYDDDRLQGAALLVDDGGLDDFDLDIPPTTGNEYLRRVRYVHRALSLST